MSYELMLPPTPHRIAVFCGSQYGASPLFERYAYALGKAIGLQKHHLVFGAGSGGLMGVVARAALQYGAEVTGIVPRFLVDIEQPVENLTHLHIVDDMATRKTMFYQLSDAFIVLPGGIGTIDELTEILTLKVLGQLNKPIMLINIQHYWTPWLHHIEHGITQGFINPRLRDCFVMQQEEHLHLTFEQS